MADVKTSGIYLVTCRRPEGLPLYYVGQSIFCERRWYQHRHELKLGRHCNPIWQRHWSKFGSDAFTFEILETLAPQDLDEAERWWLGQLVGHSRVFNICTDPVASWRGLRQSADHVAKRIRRGKDHYAFGKRKSEEHRARISAGGRGLKRSEATRAKLSAATAGAGNPMFGRLGAESARSRAVEGVCLSTGDKVRFESGCLAERAGFRQDCISRCCNGISKTHKGYAWNFSS